MVKPTKEQAKIIERELRKGTSKSRIGMMLGLDYNAVSELIDVVKKNIRPEIDDVIDFVFRDKQMSGKIVKLLTNSAVVEIDWDKSDEKMKNVCSDRMIVNFKDIGGGMK